MSDHHQQQQSVETRDFRGVRGRRIVYDTYRPDGDPRAVVVIVHGLGEHAGRYPHVAAALTAAGYLVVAPDHAGHGRSEGRRLGVNRIADFDADLDTLISLVAVDGLALFLVGHSMGGCIALDYTLDHADRADGLVLSGAAVVPGSDLPRSLMAVAKVLGRVAPRVPTAPLDPKNISKDPAVVKAYSADPLVIRGKIPAGLAGALLTTMATFPDRLPALRTPLLVMQGADDVMSDPQGAVMVDRLAGSPDKTLVMWPGLMHEIFNEPEQQEVLGEMVRWLVARTPAVGAS